jgi:hypothetical protein
VELGEETYKSTAELVEKLRVDWKRLWRERLDDRAKAEGIANEDYSSLFVERGTVILATRNFKLLTFKEILEGHRIGDVHRFVSPHPEVGGWHKFIKNSVGRGRSSVHRATNYVLEEEKKPQQLKKGGRGWLHR